MTTDSVLSALIDRVETVAALVRGTSDLRTKADLADALASHAGTLCDELRDRADRDAVLSVRRAG